MVIVVDTSVLIDFLRQPQKQGCLFLQLAKKYDLAVSFITIAELYSGKSSQNQEGIKILETLLSGVAVHFPDGELLKEAGTLRCAYNLSLADAFIAALALRLKIPLSTLNTKDFLKIKDLTLL